MSSMDAVAAYVGQVFTEVQDNGRSLLASADGDPKVPLLATAAIEDHHIYHAHCGCFPHGHEEAKKGTPRMLSLTRTRIPVGPGPHDSQPHRRCLSTQRRIASHTRDVPLAHELQCARVSRSNAAMRMQIGPSKEYIQHVGKPAIAGIVLAVLTMASFILFVIISLCCKCCNPKRGCCQRSQPLAYWRRLPYIVIVAICALIGLIGGAIVLKATPTFADRLDSLVKDQVAKVCSVNVDL